MKEVTMKCGGNYTTVTIGKTKTKTKANGNGKGQTVASKYTLSTRPSTAGPGAEECFGHGTCFRDLCVCQPGFFGAFCEQEKTCAKECARNGVCNYGVCMCAAEFTGTNCDISTVSQAALLRASGRALDTLVDSSFTCLDGDTTKCSLHGVCATNACVCDEGFVGLSCEQVRLTGVLSSRCLNKCSMHGFCQFGACVCDVGFTGKDCSEKVDMPCTDGCNGHGICEYGRCHCDADYAGITCETKLKCAVDCSVQEEGVCVAGRCICLNGYTGVDCSHAPIATDVVAPTNGTAPTTATAAATAGVTLAVVTNQKSRTTEAIKLSQQTHAAKSAATGADALSADHTVHTELSSRASASSEAAAMGQYVVPVHPAVLGVASFVFGVLVAFGITYLYNRREEQIRKKPLFATR